MIQESIRLIRWVFVLNLAKHMDRKHISQNLSQASQNEARRNGSHPHREPLYEDSTLHALMKQARELAEIEKKIGELSESCSRIRRSITTLVPALEVHMHGLQSEARRWKQEAHQAEEKYDRAFSDLELQMNTLSQHLDSTEERLQQQHQQELSRLREEANNLREALRQVIGASKGQGPSGGDGRKAASGDENVFDL